MADCYIDIISNFVGVCRPDAAGVDKAWIIKRSYKETKTVVKSLISDLTLATGTHAVMFPVTAESFDVKSVLVRTKGQKMYKHTLTVSTIARSPAEIEALLADDIFVIVKMKQETPTGGTFVAYGFNCGMKQTAMDSSTNVVGNAITFESDATALEAYPYMVVFKTSDAATETMLNSFLAA